MPGNANNIFPPSPVPPYHLPIHYKGVTTITGTGTIDLGTDTLLSATGANPGGLPYEVTLPVGAYHGQTHTILLNGENVIKKISSSFLVNGLFVDFDALLFSGIGTSAVLRWDSTGWHVVGGNAGNTDGTSVPEVPDTPAAGANVRIHDGKFQLRCPDDNLWYDVVPHTQDESGAPLGTVALSIEGDGEP